MDDKRRKLHPDQYAEIQKKYEEGMSQRALGREYGVSKSLIAIIVNPERAAKVKARLKDNWQNYYDREQHRKDILKYRRRKREMGLAIPDNDRKREKS